MTQTGLDSFAKDSVMIADDDEPMIVVDGRRAIVGDDRRAAGDDNNRTIIRSKSKVLVPVNNEPALVGNTSWT